MTSRITRVRPAGPRHAVLTIETNGPRSPREISHAVGRSRHKPRVCKQCPWRLDQVGTFPAEAFRHSAATCYDAALICFGCHMSNNARPATCAGFLLSESAPHNLLVRMAQAHRGLDLDRISSAGHALFRSYRDMAIANGVPADDPALAPIRDRASERAWKRHR
jgi:hypothetical protein